MEIIDMECRQRNLVGQLVILFFVEFEILAIIVFWFFDYVKQKLMRAVLDFIFSCQHGVSLL